MNTILLLGHFDTVLIRNRIYYNKDKRGRRRKSNQSSLIYFISQVSNHTDEINESERYKEGAPQLWGVV